MKNSELFTKVFIFVKSIIKENDFEKFVFLNDDYEIYLGINENGYAIRILKEKYFCIRFYIHNHPLEYNLPDFVNEDQLLESIKLFFLGHYNFKLDFNDSLVSVKWGDKYLSNLDKINENSNLSSWIDGLDWYDYNFKS